MVKIIQIKYDVGDNIRFFDIKKEAIKIECPCCGGSGHIIGYDNQEYECGECEGEGTIQTGEYKEYKCEKTGTISSVHVHYDSNMIRHGKFGEPAIYYNTLHSRSNIYQEDIIEKIVGEQEILAYTE